MKRGVIPLFIDIVKSKITDRDELLEKYIEYDIVNFDKDVYGYSDEYIEVVSNTSSEFIPFDKDRKIRKVYYFNRENTSDFAVTAILNTLKDKKFNEINLIVKTYYYERHWDGHYIVYDADKNRLHIFYYLWVDNSDEEVLKKLLGKYKELDKNTLLFLIKRLRSEGLKMVVNEIDELFGYRRYFFSTSFDTSLLEVLGL